MREPHKVLIDGEPYFPLAEEQFEVKKLLREVYGILWAEAYYDPYNEETEKLALRVVEKMARLNELLKFKE
jgi:hypothetical protein